VTFPTDSGSSLPTQIQAQLTWNNARRSRGDLRPTTGHSAGDLRPGRQVSSAVKQHRHLSLAGADRRQLSDRGDVVRTVSGNAVVVVTGSSDPLATAGASRSINW